MSRRFVPLSVSPYDFREIVRGHGLTHSPIVQIPEWVQEDPAGYGPAAGASTVRSVLLVTRPLYRGTLCTAALVAFPQVAVNAVDGPASAGRDLEQRRYDLIMLDAQAMEGPELRELVRLLARPGRGPVLLLDLPGCPRLLRLLRSLPRVSLFGANDGMPELRVALETVAEGRRYISAELRTAMRRDGDPRPEAVLSRTEEMALCVIGDGSSDREAAALLGVQPATVGSHRKRIMHKLRLHHAGELMCFAIEQGYVVVPREAPGLMPGFLCAWLGAQAEIGGVDEPAAEYLVRFCAHPENYRATAEPSDDWR